MSVSYIPEKVKTRLWGKRHDVVSMRGDIPLWYDALIVSKTSAWMDRYGIIVLIEKKRGSLRECPNKIRT
jgi:hypothetical protein